MNTKTENHHFCDAASLEYAPFVGILGASLRKRLGSKTTYSIEDIQAEIQTLRLAPSSTPFLSALFMNPDDFAASFSDYGYSYYHNVRVLYYGQGKKAGGRHRLIFRLVARSFLAFVIMVSAIILLLQLWILFAFGGAVVFLLPLLIALPICVYYLTKKNNG